MSDINPIARPAVAAIGVNRHTGRSLPAAETGASRAHDQVELSSAAQLLSRIGELPEIREDLVARIREEIQAGTYETSDKLDAAIDALIAEEFEA